MVIRSPKLQRNMWRPLVAALACCLLLAASAAPGAAAASDVHEATATHDISAGSEAPGSGARSVALLDGLAAEGRVPFERQTTLPNASHPFLLVHLPKCAGSSMRVRCFRFV